METQSREWLKKLGITSPCGLDKLSGVELRDLARQIDWIVSKAANAARQAAPVNQGKPLVDILD